MSTALKFAILTVLIGLASNSEGYCKWQDSDGVTHYAESCPDQAESTEVQIQPPPTREQIDESERRSEDMLSETRARSVEREREKENKVEVEKASADSRDSLIRSCAEARWNLEILKTQRPVYLDDKHRLQFNQSLFDQYYQGQRTYLEDQQRQADIARYAGIEERTCTADEADIRERIKIYREMNMETLCVHFEKGLEDMRRANTGIPSDKMREQEELINTWCR